MRRNVWRRPGRSLCPFCEIREVEPGLSQMYGREGEALERYQAIRMGQSCPAPSDCDFCSCQLSGSEQVPQTIQWRTKERTVSTEHRLLVTVEKRSWQQTSGTYYLCEKCRKVVRPGLWTALGKALLPALILAPLAVWMAGEDQPLAISLMFPALVTGVCLWFLMRSRFRGYPASMGFRVHETTFDGPEQRLITPVFILVALCFLATGLFSGGGIPVNLQLARQDGPGGTGTTNMNALDENLKALYATAEESDRKVGDLLVKGWLLHVQRGDHFYPRSPQFVASATELIRDKKLKAAEAIDILARETGGKRLARMQGGGDVTKLQFKLGRLASSTRASQWDAEQQVEKIGQTLTTIGKPKNYDEILNALLKQAETGYGKKLDDLGQAAQSELTRLYKSRKQAGAP